MQGLNKTKGKLRLVLRFLVALAVCQGVGLIGGFYTAKGVEVWYPTLTKPEFVPPTWLFAPVWLTLYTLMAMALIVLWHRRDQAGAKTTLILFMLGLALNVVWSAVFFALQRPDAAFVVIIVLWGSILLMILNMTTVERRAANLLVPYLLWVSYASVLNMQIMMLN